MIKYHFARNESGEIVDIENVTENYRDSHSFYCLGCGGDMNARLGVKKSHHFYHTSGTDCGFGESDLHRYAKKMLRKKFQSNPPFPVKLVQNVSCGIRCLFFKDGDGGCQVKRLMDYDLKSFGYDTIEEEKEVEGGFVADLLISDSSGRNPDILLEVCVSHQIGERKEKSGLRIIEVPIRNEEDLHVYLDGAISEAEPNEYRARILSRSPRFYGFKRDVQSEECLNARYLPVASMLLDNSIECTEIEHNICCSKIKDLSCCPDELLKVVFNPDTLISFQKNLGNFIRMVAVKEGIPVKNCKICHNGVPYKTYDYNRPVRCLVADDNNMETFPLHWSAIECEHFSLSKDTIADFEHRKYASVTYQTVKCWPDGRISYDVFRIAQKFVEDEGFVDLVGETDIHWVSSKDGCVYFKARVLDPEQYVPDRYVVVKDGHAEWIVDNA